MRPQVLVSGSLLLAFALMLLSSFSALACEPGDDDPLRCVNLRPPKVRVTPKPTVRPTTAASAAAVPVSTQRGTGPGDALDPTDTWTNIGAGASIWYKVGGGKNPLHLEVWLDAYGRDGVGFSVYSPEQAADIAFGIPPKGRGTINKADNRHDLWWIGNAPAGGTWYVLVSNLNSVPVLYKVGYNGLENAQRECSGPFWEYLPNGAYIQWPGICK